MPDNPTPRQQARQFFRNLRDETRDQDELEAFRLAMQRDTERNSENRGRDRCARCGSAYHSTDEHGEIDPLDDNRPEDEPDSKATVGGPSF